MKYNFDEIIDRRETNSVKWDTTEEGTIPMWVADMDFRTAAPILEAIRKKIEHGIFGYASIPQEYYDAEVLWWKKRHGFDIKKEWIEVTTGVIPSLSAVVQAFTEPGDKVLIQSPVYNYFNSSITNNKCEVILNDLIYTDGRYIIDFEDFEKKISDEKLKVFILCNPHNPVGRVWTREELQRMGELCLKHNVLVLVDEIHRDLVYSDSKYVPFASIGEEIFMNSITCTAPSKTFNIAGLKTSNIIIANENHRKKVNRSLNINETIEPNIFGIEALIAAYTQGDEWLDQLLEYLEGNRDYLMDYVIENIPVLKPLKIEGTYLMWIDCRELGIPSNELSKKILEEGKLRISSGSTYGKNGDGFIRINMACPRETLADGLRRLKNTIENIEK